MNYLLMLLPIPFRCYACCLTILGYTHGYPFLDSLTCDSLYNHI